MAVPEIANMLSLPSFLQLSLITHALRDAVSFRHCFQDTMKTQEEVGFGPSELEECGRVQGRVPQNCGGKLLAGSGIPLGCGTYGVTVQFQDTSGIEVVAKLLQTPAIEDEDIPGEIGKSTNECALMKFLQSQNAPNILRCESECMGQLQMDNHEERGNVNTPVMITSPFVKDPAHSIAALDSASVQAAQKARLQTVYSGAYMLAAGVVNPDMERNVLHARDGTTTFIDLGLAMIVHTKSENATWAELGLNGYGFVESELPFRVPLAAAHQHMRKHIDVVLLKSEGLGWPLIEETWRSAWESAGECAYKVAGLREGADEILHGLRLLRAVNFEDPRTAEANPGLVKEALNAGSAHTGQIWAGFKQEAREKAEQAVEMSEYFENLHGFQEIVELLN